MADAKAMTVSFPVDRSDSAWSGLSAKDQTPVSQRWRNAVLWVGDHVPLLKRSGQAAFSGQIARICAGAIGLNAFQIGATVTGLYATHLMARYGDGVEPDRPPRHAGERLMQWMRRKPFQAHCGLEFVAAGLGIMAGSDGVAATASKGEQIYGAVGIGATGLNLFEEQLRGTDPGDEATPLAKQPDSFKVARSTSRQQGLRVSIKRLQAGLDKLFHRFPPKLVFGMIQNIGAVGFLYEGSTRLAEACSGQPQAAMLLHGAATVFAGMALIAHNSLIGVKGLYDEYDRDRQTDLKAASRAKPATVSAP